VDLEGRVFLAAVVLDKMPQPGILTLSFEHRKAGLPSRRKRREIFSVGRSRHNQAVFSSYAVPAQNLRAVPQQPF
jgi:hypothetical protein